ncbi:hypothetical protein FRC07_002067 [Ceratobasidium sp. 392]|nr:hypothetical protein FRC07_002067 [Ceratobasidium sp. 392]
MFKRNRLVSGAGLPELVIQQIIRILNARQMDMFDKKEGRVYLTACFLNTYLFVHHSVPLLNETRTTNTERLPDLDLRQSMPAYTIAGDFLVKLLGHIYNRDPDAPLFAQYASWPRIHTELRNQFVQFICGHRPFHQTSQIHSEHAYWQSMRAVPGAELIAHLGTILTAIVPNSMSEERTMSTMTKLSSPDRAAQHVSTLIDMATIHQHYRREELAELSLRSLCPTVRFADLPLSTDAPLQIDESGAEVPQPDHQALRDASDCLDKLIPLQDSSPTGQGTTLGRSEPQGAEIQKLEIESNDGISLSSDLLTSLLSERPALLNKRSHSPEVPLVDVVPPVKREKIDVSTLEY